MPLPLILGIAAGIAGAAGIGSGISGAVKMKDANDTMESAKRRHEKCQKEFNRCNDESIAAMDSLGETELVILKSFQTFADLIEKNQNRPEFKEIAKNGVSLPKFDPEELKEVSVGAGVLLGGIGGAAAGTAGGFAAAGATTAAVMALGTASTGTAIASLSGAAATNATLAALGGGAIAAGGGGMALGTAILGGATLGVGLLVGGVIFNITGSSLSDKADEAWRQSKKEEEEVNKICGYLTDLTNAAFQYKNTLNKVKAVYDKHIDLMKNFINKLHKHDWNEFDYEQQKTVENAYMLVSILYKMCKVQLVLKGANENEMNKVNTAEINAVYADADKLLANIA